VLGDNLCALEGSETYDNHHVTAMAQTPARDPRHHSGGGARGWRPVSAQLPETEPKAKDYTESMSLSEAMAPRTPPVATPPDHQQAPEDPLGGL